MWWNQDAFTQMPSGRKSERDRLWDAFYLHFDFKPGMDSSPAIREPTPSLTFDLSPIFSAEGAAFTNAETRVNDEVLAARQSAFGDRRLAVLDSQHPAYWFQPEGFQPAELEDWAVPVFPEGGIPHDDHGAKLPVRQVPSAEHAAGVRIGDGALGLTWQVAEPRVIALMRVPRLLVNCRFAGLDEMQRYKFMKRFDLYMQRGGG